MALVEVRCPSCHAPVAEALREVMKCAYCGTTLRESKPAAAKKVRHVYAVSIERVGPSNRARVAEALRTHGGISGENALRMATQAPCELGVLDDPDRVTAIETALFEAGVGVRVETREIALPEDICLPDRAVVLETVGPDRVAVMKTVRAYIDLDMAETKALLSRAPCVLVEVLEGHRAAAFVEELARAGATARLR